MALSNRSPTLGGAAARALVAASDLAVLATLSTRLESCGLQVIARVEDIESSSWDIDPRPDLVLVRVEQGQEMAAYYIGRAASERGIATLFVAAHHQALAIDALIHAIPHSVLAEEPLSDEILAAKITTALTSLTAGMTANQG